MHSEVRQMTVKTAEEAYERIVRALPAGERLRLVEKIVHELYASPGSTEPGERDDWMSLAGIAPDLLNGEDAQEWVSRTRREADEQRESQWKPKP